MIAKTTREIIEEFIDRTTPEIICEFNNFDNDKSLKGLWLPVEKVKEYFDNEIKRISKPETMSNKAIVIYLEILRDNLLEGLEKTEDEGKIGGTPPDVETCKKRSGEEPMAGLSSVSK